MKSGVIGLVGGQLENLSSFHETFEQDGTEFTNSLQINNTDYTTGGKKVVTGEAATQEVEEETSVQVDSKTGEIVVQDEPIKRGKYTRFVAVPDEFVAVKSGSGTFVFESLSYKYNIAGVTRATIDLNEYAKRHYTAENVDPWQVGFYGNIGNAEKGTVYGEDVFSDGEIGEVLERSQLNQLGLQYEEEGHIIKLTMTESGYVELYQPSNYEATDFVEFIINNILGFTE